MREHRYDVVVIGGGAAGMAAALETHRQGLSTAIVEREETLGGILLQCVHNGFGLQEFKKELTGPEYAEIFIDRVEASGIAVFTDTTVTDMVCAGETKELFCSSGVSGIMRLLCRAVVLAMGCRERNRGNIRVPGDRPSGVYTAGLAQRLVNIEGYIPGKDVVIIGSGDIGLIMARRMKWVGCNVHGVVEILPYPSGITRNIVQCLHHFDIPLYLGHVVSKIHGRERVEKIEVTPVSGGATDYSKTFEIPCDTLLLSVGLVPENELSKNAGVELHPQTHGPTVDANLMTSVEGVFAAGNVLHVHDLVDYVSDEARRAGAGAADFLAGRRTARQVRVKAGSNVRYVNPGRIDPDGENKLFLRTMVVKNDARIEVRLDGRPVKTVKHNHVQPSEMIIVNLDKKDLEPEIGPDAVLEVSLV
jgi:NADPH-dependent 2,4-dienoyl-CoA reductase/sulfur reductase-like enzyme